ncbi:LLM class flavin-dependent oxidoreductase [Actinomadura rugatobispora]|uniref:LLM class flavin-dependent oxidoreductase n=1 Tax=Actinomadura rugatobispora TaxID=1994 RepID=A0ABW1A8B2_9ACTN|nr:LLM class flavin-dependent oxidoreductase [Actinomadura rugatobispora]
MKVGVHLPAFGVDPAAGTAEHARHAEDVGLESVWVGDHLIPNRPYLDSTLALATAAAVTERVRLGFGVMIVALRPVAWVAKQVASLQHLSGGRVLLGVGSGGPVHGDAAWRAVGVPYRERGARTDAALEALPALIAGRPAKVDGEEVVLSPGATVPPVLVGGGAATLRRAARFGDEWYAAFSGPAEIAAGLGRLRELAEEYGRPVPRLTVGVSVGLGDLPAARIDAQVRGLTDYGMSEDEARGSLIVGGPERASERFAELAEAGAHRIIAMPFPEDRMRQTELVAETAALLG